MFRDTTPYCVVIDSVSGTEVNKCQMVLFLSMLSSISRDSRNFPPFLHVSLKSSPSIVTEVNEGPGFRPSVRVNRTDYLRRTIKFRMSFLNLTLLYGNYGPLYRTLDQ